MGNVHDILDTEVEKTIENLLGIKPGIFTDAKLETALKKKNSKTKKAARLYISSGALEDSGFQRFSAIFCNAKYNEKKSYINGRKATQFLSQRKI